MAFLLTIIVEPKCIVCKLGNRICLFSYCSVSLLITIEAIMTKFLKDEAPLFPSGGVGGKGGMGGTNY